MTTPRHGPLVDPDDVPPWLRALVKATADLDPQMFRRLSLPSRDARDAAVLILFGEHEERGPDLLLQLRADGTSAHSGQVAFPGGAAEPDDAGPVETALREAVEETGVDPSGVRPVALLPRLHIPVSGFHVTPVVAHWERPSRVWAVDPAETAAVARVPVEVLADPANRFQVRHPSGFLGPAFALPGMLVWGFTAGVLTMLLSIAGWERPWDTGDVRDLETAWAAVGAEVGR
ncbi:MAG TPA: CoA pyrophosphatase [Actinophytocola sp.]|uniref:NUDIX hydrolase n=1 Tax=Actinophytocola sp. TaxID=1872138 RepID=UPI002DDD04F7|nr:CoA pyrophosphatase [Actinophytocola sp.]HEV2784601.1 CoA pyrophosphatase [Actinophytocola sp.]